MKPLRQFDGSLLQKCAAVLFVLLMAGFGFVQAVHVHDALAGRTSPASHCSLCVVAHNAVLISPPSAAPLPALSAALLEADEPQLESRLHVTSSFIRPPPQSL